MFSGLNSFIKYILPKRLFYRALIIVAAPTIILQIIITIVFYDSVWIKANKNNQADFLYQNLMIQNNIFNAAISSGTSQILFLGSSCIYPRHCNQL